MKKWILHSLGCCMMGFSCHPTVPDQVPQPNVRFNDVLGQWKMVRYEDTDTQENVAQPVDPLLGEVRMTLKADSTAEGVLNCNSMWFRYAVLNNHITIQNVASTKMGCKTDWTNLFLKTFSNPDNSPSMMRAGNTLILISENQKRKTTFNKL